MASDTKHSSTETEAEEEKEEEKQQQQGKEEEEKEKQIEEEEEDENVFSLDSEMFICHMHKNGNEVAYKCSNAECEVTKKRMEMYWQFLSKEKELLRKYEKTVELQDTITKRRKSVATHNFNHHKYGIYNGEPCTPPSPLDKRISHLLSDEGLVTPKLRRFSVPSKMLNQTHRQKKKSFSPPTRPLSCLEEFIAKSSPPGLGSVSKIPINIPDSSSLPSSPMFRRKQNIATMMPHNSTSAETLCHTIQRMRKISVSTGHLDDLARKVQLGRQSLSESSKTLTASSADNILLMARRQSLANGTHFRHNNTPRRDFRNNKRLYDSHEDLRKHHMESPIFFIPESINKQNNVINRMDDEENKQILNRKNDAALKKKRRQKLLTALNNDIKKANKYLRNLKTRSMPLLDDLDISFEIPFELSKTVLATQQRKMEKIRSASVDMIV